MSDERYDLYFKGDLLDGFFIDFVKADMARLFKTDAERIEPFFSGRPQPVKLNVDKAAAAKYQQALKGIGARLLVMPAGKAPLPKQTGPEETKPEEATVSGSGANVAASADAEQAPPWSILPPGSDIGERRETPSVEVDTRHLSVASAGAPLVDAVSRPNPPPIDTSAFTLAKPGARLIEADPTPPPPAPDTSHLTLD